MNKFGEMRRALVEELRTVSERDHITNDDLRRMGAIREEIADLDEAIAAAKLLEPEPVLPLLADGGQAPRKLPCMRSLDGREHYIFGRGDKLSDYANRAQDGMTLAEFGNALAAMAAGEPHRYREEIRSLSESSNTGGGLMVSEELSAQLIDLARARSVMFAAGVSTIAMNSSDMRLVRVTTDPTVYEPGEGSAITPSDAAFDSIQLTARKLAVLTSATNELLADAANAGEAIVQNLASVMARALDDMILNSILDSSQIGTESSVGAIAYPDLLAARLAVRLLNGEPKSIVANPNLRYDLSLLTEATTNAFLAPPAELSDLQWFETTACADSTAIVGDFSKAIVGIRQNIELKMSSEAGDAFAKDLTFFRAIVRADANIMTPHFRILAGIS